MRAIYILLYSNLPTQYCTVTVLYITGGNGPGDYNPGVGLQVDRYVSMRGMFPLSIQTLIIVQYLNILLNQNVIQSEIQKMDTVAIHDQFVMYAGRGPSCGI